DLRKCLSVGKSIVDVIGWGKTGKRPEQHIYNDFHRFLILHYVGNPKKFSYRECTHLINENCADENQKTLNESYIKKQMVNDIEFRTLVYSRRNGAKYKKDMILPHAVRYPVEFPANLWMIDGTPLQMYCVNEKGETIRLNLFIVLDVFSRKIVGFDVAFFEDKFMVMNALKMAVQDEGHLPKEILSDNFSANKTEEIIAIKEQMAKLEVNWRLAKVGNPQDKAQVERAFGVLQSEIFTFFNDYFGEGIGSRRDNRPNNEFLAIYTKKPITINEMKSRICDVVALYNEQKKRTRPSPIELYKLPKPNAVEMTLLKTALMFWTRTKHTIIQGMVKITVNKVMHQYEIKIHKIKMQLQGVQVYVRYDANDLDRVMLFDIESENVICECKKQLPIYIESDKPKDNLFKHTAKVKSYDDHLNKEWDNIKDKGLDKVGKDQIEEYRPFDLSKNQIQNQENKNLAEMHKRVNFGLTEDIHKPVPKPRKTIVKSGTPTYEDMTKSKKSPEASFKPVNSTANEN
ncbi:DDE-type integrase/transposase/recombinase, partial [Flavobacterium psychrophilum]|uniref:DDE-type integrase/transposase/recombinase n=1 Tax=Flavobacterium psychrophilum TaxID=96345 RepID=UPI00106D386D